MERWEEQLSCAAHRRSLCRDPRDIFPRMKITDEIQYRWSHAKRREITSQRTEHALCSPTLSSTPRNLHRCGVSTAEEWCSTDRDDGQRSAETDSDEITMTELQWGCCESTTVDLCCHWKTDDQSRSHIDECFYRRISFNSNSIRHCAPNSMSSVLTLKHWHTSILVSRVSALLRVFKFRSISFSALKSKRREIPSDEYFC